MAKTGQDNPDTLGVGQNAGDGPATPAPVILAGDQPQAKPPTVLKVPETGRWFPCKACGAHLDFDPGARALKCPYCGHVEEINPASASVQELDFEAYLQKLSQAQAAGQTGGSREGREMMGTLPGRSQEVRCPGCGATVLLEDHVVTESCPFCTTHLNVAAKQAAEKLIQPLGILPFALSSRQAIEGFNKWILSRWFAPSDLRQLANLGQLSGIYLPFWTYDSMTYTAYSGQRGDDYWATETYTERDAQGHTHTRTRQVRRTRWHYVSGEVDHFFDDVLVCASKSLPREYIQKLEPWDLRDLDGFTPAFLSGFRTERYTVDLSQGFGLAKQRMEPEIRQLCCQDIGGDHQTLSEVRTQHIGVTFKHILLPLWLAVYRYRDKTYQIMVNARTGEVVGSRPYSVAKILLVVLLSILAAVVLFLIIMAATGGGGRMGPEVHYDFRPGF